MSLSARVNPKKYHTVPLKLENFNYNFIRPFLLFKKSKPLAITSVTFVELYSNLAEAVDIEQIIKEHGLDFLCYTLNRIGKTETWIKAAKYVFNLGESDLARAFYVASGVQTFSRRKTN